jgi:hypothetical protein
MSWPVTAARVCPAADRATADVRARSCAAVMAATIGGAVHPVMPAKHTFVMTGPYGSQHNETGRRDVAVSG